MTKYKYSYRLLFLIMVLAGGGCDSFLDEDPDNRTDINTTEKVQELLVDGYPNATYAYFCTMMSDNAGDKGSGLSATTVSTNSYYWEEVFSSTSQDTPEYFWDECYEDVAVANEALDALAEIEEEDVSAALRAEARLIRAYAHFMLVNLWATSYDSITAATDLGVPIVTAVETEVFADYDRASVEEVYDFIETEIEEAIPDIDDQLYASNTRVYHFNAEAASAFAVRYYLFKGDWDKVIEYAGNVIGSDLTSRMRDWNGDLQDATYAELEAGYADPANDANLLIVEAKSWWARRYTKQRYGITATIKDDVLKRDNPTGEDWDYRIFGALGYYNVPKFDENFVSTSASGDTGLGYVELPLFAIEEVLLSRAEAYIMRGEYDNAIADLNTFYSKRIEDYDESMAVTKETVDAYYEDNSDYVEALDPFYELENDALYVLQAIVDARRLEFVEEGLRWFDIRRFHLPVIHYYGDSESIDHQDTMTLSAEDNRKQLQIPVVAQTVIEANPR